MSILKNIKLSLHPKNPTTTLSVSAICVALYVILSMLQIPLSPSLKIVFASLMLGVSATLVGFFPSILVAIVADIIQHFLFPTGAFFIGFTINTVITAIIYSVLFYNQKITVTKAVIARALVVVICHLILTPIWLSILMGDTAVILNWPRVAKNIIMFPIDTALLYFVVKKAQDLKPNKLKNE